LPRTIRQPGWSPPPSASANKQGEHKTHPILASFRRHLNAEGKAQTTADGYVGCAAQFLAFATDQALPDIPHLRREHVELWIESLFARYKPASVVNRFNGLRIFMAWLLEEGEIRANPMEHMKRPRVPETSKDVVDAEAIGRAFAYLEKNHRLRDAALLAVLYDTGARATEIAEALTADLDLNHGTLLIPKTKNRQVRQLSLSPKAIRYLDRYHRKARKQPEYVFNGPKGKLTRSGVYWAVRSIFEEMGYPAIIGPHDLRHTSATHSVGHISESAMMTLYGWTDSSMPRHYARKGLVAAAHEEHKKGSPLERL
jgi:integrase/recombinase XerD